MAITRTAGESTPTYRRWNSKNDEYRELLRPYLELQTGPIPAPNSRSSEE